MTVVALGARAFRDINLGDHITFKAVCRWPTRKVTRKVTGFYNGWPTVRFDGCTGFVVRPSEITKVWGVLR